VQVLVFIGNTTMNYCCHNIFQI